MIEFILLIGIVLALYGLFFNFTDARGTSAQAKHDHDVKGIFWGLFAIIGLPIFCAILTAMGGS